MDISEILLTLNNGDTTLSLLDLVTELSSKATYATLTEDYAEFSEEDKETRFSADHLYSVDNGDIYYLEDAQDLFNSYYSYYEITLKTILNIK